MRKDSRVIGKTGLRPAELIKLSATGVGLAIALLTASCSTPFSSSDVPQLNVTNGHDVDPAELDR
jgi:hypothetical protein